MVESSFNAASGFKQTTDHDSASGCFQNQRLRSFLNVMLKKVVQILSHLVLFKVMQWRAALVLHDHVELSGLE